MGREKERDRVIITNIFYCIECDERERENLGRTKCYFIHHKSIQINDFCSVVYLKRERDHFFRRVTFFLKLKILLIYLMLKALDIVIQYRVKGSVDVDSFKYSPPNLSIYQAGLSTL